MFKAPSSASSGAMLKLRLLNPPIKVYFAGWESDTFALHRAGWEISAEQDVVRASMRLAFKHPQLKIYALTNMIDMHYMADFQLDGHLQIPMLQIQHMVSRMEIVMPVDFSKFEPVSGEPQMVDNFEKKDIESFKIFKPINNSKEIVIAPANTKELLDKILKYQDPKQKEIREKKRKMWKRVEGEVSRKYTEEYNPAKDIIAQVVAIN